MSNANHDAPSHIRSVLIVAIGLVTMAGMAACGGDGQGNGSAGDTASASAGPGSGMPSAGGQQGGMMTEMRQLQKRLSSIQKQAMQDSALQSQMQEVQALIDSTIRAMSPQAAQQMERLDSIRGQLQAAQSQGDTARLRSLIMEAQKLQKALQKVQSKAMKQEDVAAAIKSFQNALREQMRQVDPTADSLIDRADSLQSQMQGQAQQLMGGSSDTAGG